MRTSSFGSPAVFGKQINFLNYKTRGFAPPGHPGFAPLEIFLSTVASLVISNGVCPFVCMFLIALKYNI
jgi:hypothetical protein